MKIALYKNVPYNFESIWQDGSHPSSDYARISEFVDVDFQPLANDEAVLAQVEVMNEMERAVNVEYTKKLQDIRQRRQELLAIAAPVSP